MAAIGAQPSPPNTPATVSYLIPLRTFPAGDWAGSPCPKGDLPPRPED
jgi:hypothetical protein